MTAIEAILRAIDNATPDDLIAGIAIGEDGTIARPCSRCHKWDIIREYGGKCLACRVLPDTDRHGRSTL